MKKSLLLIMLTGTSLVRPQIQECNFVTGSGNFCSVLDVTAESTKAAICGKAGSIRVILTTSVAFDVPAGTTATITLDGPNNFSSITTLPIQSGPAQSGGSSTFEVSAPTGGSYTVTTTLNTIGGNCIFRCTNVRVKQRNCFLFLCCCK